MDDQTKASYAYDPFQQEGRDRWGRKGSPKAVPPKIPNYDLIDFLGEGGMASVWSAKYRPLNQPRALKILSQAMAIDANFVERFAEEARALARLEHPNIVKVYDASTELPHPYLAMDFVPGKTLHDIQKEKNLTQDEALRYFANIADALDYAHGMGFVHRDIKASNVMIAASGKAMLIDFGVASWLGGVGEKPKTMTGTLRYMSPEACRGERVTMASDLWAFGVLMYRTLTGSMPFDGKNEQEIMNAILKSPPKEPKHPNGKVRALLKQFLTKEVDQRPKSAGAMVNELNRAVRPFILKANKEGLAVGMSFLMAGAVVVAIVGGVIGYFVYFNSGGKTVYIPKKSKTFLSDSKGASGGSSDSKGSGSGSGAVSGASVSELGGIWYGADGDEWTEIRIEPTTGQKFHAVIEKRDSSGAEVVEADGELQPDNKIGYHETAVDSNPGGKSTSLAKFVGEFAGDHNHVTGKVSSTVNSGVEARWCRLGDMETSPYQNSQMGFTVPVPMGWETTAGESTTISPISRRDVAFMVTVAPANGAQNVADIFKPIEDDLASATDKGGSYANLGTNFSASFGGKQGGLWELNHQAPGGPKRHAIIFGTIQGDYAVTVQSWWPISEEDIWSPILDLMRKKFAFSN